MRQTIHHVHPSLRKMVKKVKTLRKRKTDYKHVYELLFFSRRRYHEVDANQVATLVGGRAVPPLTFDDTPGKPERAAHGHDNRR